MQVALPVLLSKVPAQLSASHDCVLGGQVGVGVADNEVVDNEVVDSEVDVTVVLSEVDNVVCETDVEEVVLDGMATMTEEGQAKYRITPGVDTLPDTAVRRVSAGKQRPRQYRECCYTSISKKKFLEPF